MDVSPPPSSMAQFLMNSGGSSCHENSPSNKWPKCTKTYNSRWETDPLLKTWIARHPGDNGKVVCRFCQSVIRAHKNDLLEHTRTLKHQRNFMAHVTPEEYNQFVLELNELRKDSQVVTTKKSKTTTAANGTKSQNNNNNNNNNSNSQSGRDLSNSSWTVVCRSPPTVASLDGSVVIGGGGGGISVGGGNQIELWPSENNDSYMSAADSPSDLVSVVLEEQPFAEQGGGGASPQGSLNSNESSSSLSAAGLITSSLSSSHHHQQALGTTSTVPMTASTISLNNGGGGGGGGNNRRDVKHDSPPFSCQDVISAIEDNYFSLNELVALAKSALGQIECSLNRPPPPLPLPTDIKLFTTTASSSDVKLFTTTSTNNPSSSPSYKFAKNGAKQLRSKDMLVRRRR